MAGKGMGFVLAIGGAGILMALIMVSPTGTGWAAALVNCHTHTNHSIDSEWTLEEAMTWHKDEGFNAAYITDHLSSYNPLPWVCDTPAMDRWNRENPDCPAMPGVEWTTMNVHLLMLNVEYWDEYVPAFPREHQVEAAIDHCHELGGIAIMAHPTNSPTPSDGWPGSGIEIENEEINPYTWAEIKAMGADGVEGWNGGFEDYYSAEAADANASGLIVTTGTDAHGPWSPTWSERFSMAYTRITVPCDDREDIMAAIATGQCEITE